jgi:hypothetical protein
LSLKHTSENDTMKYALTLTALAFSGLAQAAPLYMNAPNFIDGSGKSVLNSAAGDGTFGFGAQTASNNTVAEDFSVGAAGWRVASIDFFGYQTAASGFTFTTATWSILSGSLNEGMVVAGGTTAVSDGGRVGFRVLDTSLANTDRAIQRIHTDMADFDLAAGNYWLTWSLVGTSSSGPWVPPSVDAAGNAQQRSAASGNVFQQVFMGSSNRAVSLPFTINGPAVAAVPEPSSAALVLLAGGLLIGARRQRRQIAAVA